MGILILEIGTHSFRKGVASFLSGLPGGPNAIAIYLRAGWSLGPVTSRYIMEGQGNDQLCGRAATGLPITEPSFADLPAHFDLSAGEVLSVTQWEEILPGYSTFYPQSFRQVLPFLLASICFHRQFLVDNLPATHPLFLTRLWTSGLVATLEQKVHTGTGQHPVTRMRATGIPPHILLANEFVALRGEVRNMKDELIQKLEEVPEHVKLTMLENFRVDGTVPITMPQVQSMMAELQATIMTAIAEQGASNRAVLLQTVAATAVAPPTNTGFVPFHWNEMYHAVPITFRFPR